MTEKKQRVPKGEPHWYLDMFNNVEVHHRNEREDSVVDENQWKNGNYFNSREDAEAMAEKIRKVLKGADVIDVTTANAGSVDELDAKKRQIELILNHRQTIVITEHEGVLDWCWNTKSLETRNDMLKTVISENEINFTDEVHELSYADYLLAEAKHKVK